MAEPLRQTTEWGPHEAFRRLTRSRLFVTTDPTRAGTAWRWLGTPDGFVLAMVPKGLQDIELFPEFKRFHAAEGGLTWPRTTLRLRPNESGLAQRAAEHLARIGAPGVWVGEGSDRWFGWLGCEDREYGLVEVRDGRDFDSYLNVLRSTAVAAVQREETVR